MPLERRSIVDRAQSLAQPRVVELSYARPRKEGAERHPRGEGDELAADDVAERDCRRAVGERRPTTSSDNAVGVHSGDCAARARRKRGVSRARAHASALLPPNVPRVERVPLGVVLTVLASTPSRARTVPLKGFQEPELQSVPQVFRFDPVGLSTDISLVRVSRFRRCGSPKPEKTGCESNREGDDASQFHRERA